MSRSGTAWWIHQLADDFIPGEKAGARPSYLNAGPGEGSVSTARMLPQWAGAGSLYFTFFRRKAIVVKVLWKISVEKRCKGKFI